MQKETSERNASSHTVHAQASKVANLLTTGHAPKKHGGYNLYRDEKIVIALDTYVPNMEIQIVSNDGKGRPITVFSAAYHSLGHPTIFRPGHWMDRLEQLHRRALEVEEERRAQRERNEAEDLELRYAPVDDAPIFTEVPDPQGGPGRQQG